MLFGCFVDVEVCFIIFNDVSPTMEHIYHPIRITFGQVA